MEPHIGRIAFNLGILVLMLSIIPLSFLNRDSPEFVADVIALTVSISFLILVAWDVRRQVKRVKP